VPRKQKKLAEVPDPRVGKLFCLVKSRQNIAKYGIWNQHNYYQFDCSREDRNGKVIISLEVVLLFLGLGKSHGRRGQNGSQVEHVFLDSQGELRLILPPKDFTKIFRRVKSV